MKVPQQAPPRIRGRFALAKASGGVRPQGCSSGQTLCSCAFTNTCCSSGSTCGCPFGFAACE
jgi:hypothetical protein